MVRDPDKKLCEELARRGAKGDGAACRQLVEYLWRSWMDLIRASRSMGSLAQSDDHVHNVVTRLVAKFGRQDGRDLGHYATWRERHPDKGFSDWMRIVVTNVIRDYVREQLGPRPAVPAEPSVKRLLNEVASSPALEGLGVRPPYTDAQTARQLLDYAETRLPPEQLRTLELWLGGATFQEIGGQLGMLEDQARKLLRAAVAVLRRHFGTAGDANPPNFA